MKPGLSEEHVAAINRDRQVVLNFDAFPALMKLDSIDAQQMEGALFSFMDEPGTRMDSVWWCFTSGNEANWPSRILPRIDKPSYNEWAEKGFDPVQFLLDETRRRGKEAFFSYRINGTDSVDYVGRPVLPMKEANPDWLMYTWGNNLYVDHTSPRHSGMWNFAFQGVRDYKLSILREVAEDYEFDGMEIDFARDCPVLPPGHQWERREAVTDFMRSVRSMLLDVERRRGRPFLLAARVPENLEGCHFDGFDVEAWAREELVDIFVMGVRNFDVDVAAFRRITAGTSIKLYPALDDHHSSDGYRFPPMEVFRGVLANWRRQGADGVQTFNFAHASSETLAGYGLYDIWSAWATHLQFYRELADPESMQRADKVFVLQRRGGGHGPTVVPNPEDWTTPRWMYFNTNMLAPLPARLDGDGKADTLLSVSVADDLASEAEHIEQLTVRVLLSDGAADGLPDAARLERVVVATMAHPDLMLFNVPPALDIGGRIELRLNNALLDTADVDGGWLVSAADPEQFALGNNLVGIRLSGRSPDAPGEATVEKLEVHVRYRQGDGA